MNHEIWYRYEDVSYAVLSNAETESWSSRLTIELREYPVLRQTPKGVWLDIGVRFEGFASIHAACPRFVLRGARRRFACPTIEEARASFVARKQRQLGIYEARARRAREALRKLDQLPPDPVVRLAPCPAANP